MRIWVICIAGLLLRLLCARGDLWLDEIWSIQLAEQASSPLDIFDSLHHDNNHYLNTLGAYVLNGSPYLWLYRLPAVLAGTLAIAVAAKCGRSTRESIVLAILFAFSFLFVFYSSEARGYAYVMLFALAAYVVANSSMPTLKKTLAFTAVCTLGFLSHLTFLYAFAGFAAAGLISAVQNRNFRETRLWMTLPSALFALFLWYIDIRHLQFGGDQPSSLLANLADTANLMMGARLGYFAGFAMLLVIAVAAARVLASKYENPQDKAFFITTILLAPAVLLLIREQSYLSARYFLIPAVFAMILIARAISSLPTKILTCFLIAFALSNVYAVVKQTQETRGRYSEALAYMCADGKIVGGDHDLRIAMVANFYARRTEACAGFRYLEILEISQTPPDWIILSSLDRDQTPAASISPPGAGKFTFTREFHSGDMSGWSWWIYKRDR